jgi:hypothetical protein
VSASGWTGRGEANISSRFAVVYVDLRFFLEIVLLEPGNFHEQAKQPLFKG